MELKTEILRFSTTQDPSNLDIAFGADENGDPAVRLGEVVLTSEKLEALLELLENSAE